MLLARWDIVERTLYSKVFSLPATFFPFFPHRHTTNSTLCSSHQLFRAVCNSHLSFTNTYSLSSRPTLIRSVNRYIMCSVQCTPHSFLVIFHYRSHFPTYIPFYFFTFLLSLLSSSILCRQACILIGIIINRKSIQCVAHTLTPQPPIDSVIYIAITMSMGPSVFITFHLGPCESIQE